MSRFPCLNNKAEHKKRKINHRSCQSTEWKVVRSVLASSWVCLVSLNCGCLDVATKYKLRIYHFSFMFVYFSFRLLLLFLHRPPTLSLCCGPLGCPSTARSVFDICWNAQWSVQAWKDIQCFDPKPLVSFSSPSPFHQKLLCDIVHWHVGSQTKAWIYFNFQQWKKPPLPTWRQPHTYAHADTMTRTNTHGRIHAHDHHTETQNAQMHKKGLVWNRNHCRPALSLRLKYFMSTPKTRWPRGNPVMVDSYLQHENNHSAYHHIIIQNEIKEGNI